MLRCALLAFCFPACVPLLFHKLRAACGARSTKSSCTLRFSIPRGGKRFPPGFILEALCFWWRCQRCLPETAAKQKHALFPAAAAHPALPRFVVLGFFFQ